MDGVFVPNISFGMPVISAITKHAKKTLDVHLMIVNPDQYIPTFAELGADILTVHYEACTHLHRTLQAIKAEGMKAGVALNPHTPIAVLEDLIKILIGLYYECKPWFWRPILYRKYLQKVNN